MQFVFKPTLLHLALPLSHSIIILYSEIRPIGAIIIISTTFFGKNSAQANLSMSYGTPLLIFNVTVGIFNMCQALISIYKIFRRTPASTDIGQRNGETTTATSNENVQNVDNRNDIAISIDTMDETYVLTNKSSKIYSNSCQINHAMYVQ